MSHAPHTARNHRSVLFSRPTVSSIAWSLQSTCPTHASSHLTIFPKHESHNPMHPCPRIPAVHAPRAHAHQSVATSHARHLSPCVHARTRTPRSISVTKPILEKNCSLLDHSCMPHDCPHHTHTHQSIYHRLVSVDMCLEMCSDVFLDVCVDMKVRATAIDAI